MGFLPYTYMKFIDLSFPTFRFKKRNKQTKRPFSIETGFMEFSDLATHFLTLHGMISGVYSFLTKLI